MKSKKSEQLFMMLNEIDERLVDNAWEDNSEAPMEIRAGKKRLPIWKIGLSAACLAAVMGAGIFAAVKYSAPSELAANDSPDSEISLGSGQSDNEAGGSVNTEDYSSADDIPLQDPYFTDKEDMLWQDPYYMEPYYINKESGSFAIGAAFPEENRVDGNPWWVSIPEEQEITASLRVDFGYYDDVDARIFVLENGVPIDFAFEGSEEYSNFADTRLEARSKRYMDITFTADESVGNITFVCLTLDDLDTDEDAMFNAGVMHCSVFLNEDSDALDEQNELLGSCEPDGFELKHTEDGYYIHNGAWNLYYKYEYVLVFIDDMPAKIFDGEYNMVVDGHEPLDYRIPDEYLEGAETVQALIIQRSDKGLLTSERLEVGGPLTPERDYSSK